MTFSRTARVAFWFAITIWCAALVTAGVSAAMIFPTLKSAGVSLSEYSAVPQSDGCAPHSAWRGDG